MGNRRISLPILVSFNELAWIIVFALLVAIASESARRDAEATESTKTQTRLAALVKLREDDAGLRKELIGLKGNVHRVVFVVDRSGSMRIKGRFASTDRWAEARAVVRAWLEHLRIRS